MEAVASMKSLLRGVFRVTELAELYERLHGTAEHIGQFVRVHVRSVTFPALSGY